ncbi:MULTISPECIES: hypothetical protein [unclassified Archaeoglobus]|jgi:hypothetical protein|uniref:hypothetical protein n=1 Tax=unclassified Archaeoglobus TaxID=2643606 RepID=UPI0025BDE950|nr:MULTISPECIES: hypothetical protein [unclassified Archaeoglobus]
MGIEGVVMSNESPIVVVIPPASSIDLAVTLEVPTPIAKIETLGLLLFADVAYVEPSLTDKLQKISKLVEIRPYPDEIYLTYNNGLDRVDNLLFNTIRFAAENYALLSFLNDEELDNMMEIVHEYGSEYRPLLYRSSLVCDILRFIVSNELSPDISNISEDCLQQLAELSEVFKEDLQTAVLYYTERLSGQRFLNQQNKFWLKEEISRGQQEVLRLLSPEKLKKFDKSALISDGIQALVSYIFGLASIPAPISTILEAYRQIKSKRVLSSPRAKLGWATLVIKRILMSGLSTINEPSKCIVCSLTLEEIERMSKDDAEKIIKELFKPENLCEEHMVAWLNIRKSRALFGKNLLLAMKKIP